MDNNVKDYLSDIGKKGGETTKQKHGKEYYQKLQKLSVESRKRNKKRG